MRRLVVAALFLGAALVTGAGTANADSYWGLSSPVEGTSVVTQLSDSYWGK
ncbi:hypothetical protein OH807_21825 [Kitasatospora sp. NBC_01560]|uniref:hypothetical protein n=1 Tax=Kitasatospora sp. NBC_01560 TaxID=2975965 RepID=UPI003865AC94